MSCGGFSCTSDGIQASPTTTPLALLKPPHDTPGILMLSDYKRLKTAMAQRLRGETN